MRVLTPHLLAVDDAPFKKSDDRTLLVGVVHDEDLTPWRVVARPASVDGSEATRLALELVRLTEPRLVLVDSVTCCGFNFIDGEAVWRETRVPVVHVFLYPLDMAAVRRALEKAGLLDERLEVIERHWSRSVRIDCRLGGFWVTVWGGVEPGSVCRLQLYSRVPTPLQNAHRLARVLWEALRSGLNPGGSG